MTAKDSAVSRKEIKARNLYAQAALQVKNFNELESILDTAIKHQFRERETSWYHGSKRRLGYAAKDAHITKNSQHMVALARLLLSIGKDYETAVVTSVYQKNTAIYRLIRDYISRIIDGQLLDLNHVKASFEAITQGKFEQDISVDRIQRWISNHQNSHKNDEFDRYQNDIVGNLSDYKQALEKTRSDRGLERIRAKSRYTFRYLSNTVNAKMGHFSQRKYSNFTSYTLKQLCL